METQSKIESPLIMTIKDWDEYGNGKMKLKQIDLIPLQDVINCNGLRMLIHELRTIHHNYSHLIINSLKENLGLDDNFEDQLYYLKDLADTLEKIRDEATVIEQ